MRLVTLRWGSTPHSFGTYFLSAVLILLKDRGDSYYTYNYYRYNYPLNIAIILFILRQSTSQECKITGARSRDFHADDHSLQSAFGRDAVADRVCIHASRGCAAFSRTKSEEQNGHLYEQGPHRRDASGCVRVGYCRSRPLATPATRSSRAASLTTRPSGQVAPNTPKPAAKTFGRRPSGDAFVKFA